MRCINFFLFAILLSGCQIPSRVAMNGGSGREDYNIAMQRTTNEQMLLNLVRLRYVDFPFFLDVSSITTQFSVGQKGGFVFPAPGFNQTNPAEITGEMNWQNTPTISYTPLEGQTFALQLFRPIDLLTIEQLIYAGWDIGRVLRLCVQSLDDLLNAPTASAPMPDYEPQFRRFLEVARILRYFQERSELEVTVEVTKQKNDYTLGKGLEFIFPSDGMEAKQLCRLLKSCKKKGKNYIYKTLLGFNQPAETGVMPRSLMAAMYYLSLGVEIPDEHRSTGQTWDTKTSEGLPFDWKEMLGDLIIIKSSKTKPSDALVAIQYRNFWFYISDRDIRSKRTFILLLQLYNLQSSAIKQGGPVLTLPVIAG